MEKKSSWAGATSISTDPILDALNEPQRKAILHEEGPLLVIAGAGSGKTRVITRRIAHLIRLGHHPSSILGLTFTNKAAQEMRNRVGQLVGSSRVFLSTFHSMCARFLRMDGTRIGIPNNYTIYDTEDQRSLVKDLLKELNLDTTHYRAAGITERISRLKNEGVSSAEAAVSKNYYLRVVASVYERYVEKLKANQALDFDDLLLETVRLLEEDSEVLERYRDRFRFILIDEYQDTNMVQYNLARLLTGNAMNLCATGDPDQSIYTWRGASIRNILEFEKDFPGAQVIKLEQNYRSTGNVVKAAAAVIENNCLRKERALWTEAPDGDPITLYSALSESDEADFVIRSIVDQQRAGRGLSQIAVFYRTNALSRAFERSLSLNNIPYAIIGGVEFFERREIKDLMAYLKLLENPKDSVALFRVINTPPRAIGHRTVGQVKQIAFNEGMAPLDAARKICRENLLPVRQVSALGKFLELFDGLAALPKESVEGLLKSVLAATAYSKYLESLKEINAAERIDNVNELIYAVAEYDRNNPGGSLHGFLEETTLIRGIDSWEEGEERVVLMTLHSAKGLEFEAVFLVGLEDGVLPHMLTLDNEDSIEEERRLFYVGITRAREKLTISRSASRVRSGSISTSLPSRFLRELPQEVLAETSHFRRTAFAPAAFEEEEGQVLEYDENIAPEFRKDDRVLHPYFGRGVVLHVSGAGNSARIKIRFAALGEKLLLVRSAKLKTVL